jgi:hypothetical protein
MRTDAQAQQRPPRHGGRKGTDAPARLLHGKDFRLR